MPKQPVNPVIVTTLTQCIDKFKAQAAAYAEGEDEWGFADLATGDADYNQTCLNHYQQTGDYQALIYEIMYQDTLPREKVIWAMMQAGCYE